MVTSEVGIRRITNTRLIDHDGVVKYGNFLLHEDGSFSQSNGDEDVIEVIDGSMRLITRSFQNWHTHLPMVLNRGMGEGLPLMEWLEKSILWYGGWLLISSMLLLFLMILFSQPTHVLLDDFYEKQII